MSLGAADLIVGIVLVIALTILAVWSKSIDFQGAGLGALISLAALFAGGFAWLAIIVVFFGVSSLFTRFHYEYKRKLGSAQEKGGTRSWPNTAANGLVSGVASLGAIYAHQEIFAIAFLGSMAAAMSDTIATEVGVLSRSRPRSIVNLKTFVSPGTSGGISFLGEFAGLTASLGIATLGVGLGIIGGSIFSQLSGFVAVVLSGFIATNFDSLLGATIQSQNKCQICGSPTERLLHHGKRTVTVKGVNFVENNVVNLIATCLAALISIGAYLLFVP